MVKPDYLLPMSRIYKFPTDPNHNTSIKLKIVQCVLDASFWSPKGGALSKLLVLKKEE